GNPQQGLAFWVFGPNYWTRETKQVQGTGYTYELTSSKTSDLSPGQYYCIVQHPMYNGVFDVYVSGDKVVSSDGESFVISGSSKLQGSAAAYALMRLLDSPNIDDTYTTNTFIIAEPWIAFSNRAEYTAGNRIYISGTTNLAPGDKLIYNVLSSSFVPTQKTQSSEFSGESGTITVGYGSPDNIWGFYLDTTNLKPDEYTVNVEKNDGTVSFTGKFTLVAPSATTPATPAVTAVPTENPAPSQPATAPTPMPTQSPLSAYSALFAIAAAIAAVGISAAAFASRGKSDDLMTERE
ncbi:MAG: PGF-CTERM sorting domain-containing protein, partial [Methanomicrobium sp.]|nr:PGF-CTERM sorting domain-containing protein [Methanomicrobium sp.]